MNVTDKTTESALHGRPAAPGIAVGDIYLLLAGQAAVPHYHLARKRDTYREINRFDRALERLRKRFEALNKKLSKTQSQDPLLILQTHVELLDDPHLREATIRLIEQERVNAESAFHRAVERVLSAFAEIEDEYLRARGDDIVHLERAVLQELAGARRAGPRDPDENSIVVAIDLAPHETIELAQIPIAGLITERGSAVSHTAIIARTFGIPLIVGATEITTRLLGGHTVAMDGTNGTITLDPSEADRAVVRRKHGELARKRERERLKSQKPAQTTDAFEVCFFANIEAPEEISQAIRHGAQGIGLFRTEFMFLNRESPPSTGEMARYYTRVVKKMQGRPVTFRTVDLGADKLPSNELSPGLNPAMGLRGIRRSLHDPEWFENQLTALFRAARHGPLRILLPMISSHDELRQAQQHIENVRKREKADPVPVGVMIETPSSVVLADLLAQNCDFFSIGTNDLVQYALAVDRTNTAVADIYSPLNPAILRLLHQVTEVARETNLELTVCGEMASDPLFTLVLLGLGINTLSMNPRAIPRIHAMIRRSTRTEAEHLLQGLMALQDVRDIERVLRRTLEQNYLDLL